MSEYRVCLETEGCSAVLRAKAAPDCDWRELSPARSRGPRTIRRRGRLLRCHRLEGQLCRNETVVVAGSGNSAGQAAMFLSEGAAKVLVRR